MLDLALLRILITLEDYERPKELFVIPKLIRMEAKGLIESKDGSRKDRRLYRITDKGEQLLTECREG